MGNVWLSFFLIPVVFVSLFVCLFISFYLKGCVLSKSLPHELKIVKVSTAGKPRYGVYCGQLHIKKGMRFGPYTGSIVCPETMAIGSVQREFLWEVKHLRLLSRLFNCRFRVKHLSLGGNLLYSYRHLVLIYLVCMKKKRSHWA